MKLLNEPSTKECEIKGNETFGFIHSIESFGTVDGPGIRYVIFFQGCPMRCQYCHNPDTWKVNAGRKMSVEEILSGYEKNAIFYKKGGITATGGEPLLQLSFLTKLFWEAKKRNIHTCLDTSGICYRDSQKEDYKKLLFVTDYIMLDMKHVQNKKHQALTGMENDTIFDFLLFLLKEKKSVRIRHVLVPTITLNREDLLLFGEWLAKFPNIKELELLPYHKLGVSKYQELGLEYPLKDLTETTAEQTAKAKRIIMEGYRRKIHTK